MVDFSEGRFGETVLTRAVHDARALGYVLVQAACADDRLMAWIDWRFAPSWWSAEARAANVIYALDRNGAIAGFAAFDARGHVWPWLRGYRRRTDIGIFGPFGVASEHRKTGLGAALLNGALAALAAKGYARALIPAVGFERLRAMYERRTGARVVDEYGYETPRRFRATILASGGGTNAQNIFDRSADGRLPLDIGALIANTENAPVLERARQAHVRAHTLVWNRAAESRSAYDARVIETVAATEPDLVLLLGWMHLLPATFIDRFGEILNVHPAFLPFDPLANDVVMPDGTSIPAFRGAHAVRDALAAGVGWSGASVHRVTAEIDRGAILVRTPLELDGSPSAPDVAGRLRPIEHAAVAAAIRRWTFER